MKFIIDFYSINSVVEIMTFVSLVKVNNDNFLVKKMFNTLALSLNFFISKLCYAFVTHHLNSTFKISYA